MAMVTTSSDTAARRGDAAAARACRWHDHKCGLPLVRRLVLADDGPAMMTTVDGALGRPWREGRVDERTVSRHDVIGGEEAPERSKPRR